MFCLYPEVIVPFIVAAVNRMAVVRTYEQMFQRAAGAGENAVIVCPGASGMVMLLSTETHPVSVEAVEEVYAAEAWVPEHYVSYKDSLLLARAVGRKEDCESDIEAEISKL